LFSQDLQSNPDLEIEKQLIMNLLLLNQNDGSRLLNYNKYKFDPRIKKIAKDINFLLKSSRTTPQKVDAIFHMLDQIFLLHFEIPLLKPDNLDEDYHAFQTIHI
jgi:hypothetical protein